MLGTLLKSAAALSLALLPPAVLAGDSLWKPYVPLPNGNAGFAARVVAGRLMVAGGTCWQGDQKLTLDAALVLDETAGNWRQIGRLPRAFGYGACASFGETLCMIGGDDGSVTHSDGWAIGVDGNSRAWGKFPKPLACCGSIEHEGSLFILGGTEDFRDLSKGTAEFWRLDRSSGRVERLAQFPGGGVMQTALAVAGNRIFAFGGCTFVATGREVENKQHVWCYQPGNGQWREVAPYPFAVRGLAACALDDNHILLAGGYRDASPGGPAEGFTAECFLYDALRDRYHPLPPLPCAVMQPGLVRNRDCLYLIGGEDRRRHRSKAVHRAVVAALQAAAVK